MPSETLHNGASFGIKTLPFTLADPELFKQDAYVNGQWVTSKSGARFDVIDPGSDLPWASCPINGAPDVENAVQAAHSAFLSYRLVNPRKRAEFLLEWHRLINLARDDLAKILVHETGKPLVEAYGEIDYAQGFTWWFAGEAERIQGSVSTPAAPNRRVFTVKQPIGVTAALVPWNFPIAMILRKAGAALAAGCTMIVKPSPETPLTCLTLAHLAAKAGFPPGVFSVLTTDLEQTPALSEALCRHLLVKKVTFTGSTRIGKLIARLCSDGLKKVTLELGGNCPFLVFDDANLNQALEALLSLKWRHAGQACVTANRVYVQAGVYDKFAAMLIAATQKLVVGHGYETGTTMGPVTTPRSLNKATLLVEDARKHGGKILLGGNRIDGRRGYFFEPTIIGNSNSEMLITREEAFAPICALYRFETEDEVVAAANDTSMGLASYFFTKDIDRTWRLLENLEAGMIGMNTGKQNSKSVASAALCLALGFDVEESFVKIPVGNSSAAESPFGGLKESGYGKESGKDVAIAEYLVTKTGTLTLQGHY